MKHKSLAAEAHDSMRRLMRLRDGVDKCAEQLKDTVRQLSKERGESSLQLQMRLVEIEVASWPRWMREASNLKMRGAQ